MIHWFSKETFLSDLWDDLIKVDFQKPKLNEFDFEEAPKAFDFFQSGKSIGKVILIIKDE